ncbi:MAG: dockerin type I repeat-containing protein [Clostridia bacterium]|nr:dockerin type I repeat-containing protein [Clostridia bacterium]
MKKNFVKSLALVMCVIITCLSVSVGSFAASGNVYNVSELKGYEISSVTTNDSETIALVSLDSGEKYAVTKNGKDYTILNFDKYLPKGSEWIKVFDFTQKDDTFVFLLRAYKTEVVKETFYDENGDKYEEEIEKYVIAAQIVLTTTDFSSYKKYTLKNLYDDTIETTEHLYSAFGLFDFVGDTLVLADTSRKITKENSSETYGVGVYWVTNDFENWTMKYTPEHNLSEGEWTSKGFSYKVIAGKVLLVEYADFAMGMERGWDCHKSYVTSDFNNYNTVYTQKNSEYVEVNFIMNGMMDYCYRLETRVSIDDNGFVVRSIKWIKVDLKTGKENSLLQKDNVADWRYIFVYDNVQDSLKIEFLLEKINGAVEGYILEKGNNKIENASVTYKLSNSHYYGFQKLNLFFSVNGKICVSTSSSMFEYTEEYDISSIGFISESGTNIFCLNGKVYIIGNVAGDVWYEDKVKVAETNISLQKKGDIDSNGKINSTDALVILQSAVGKVTLSKEQKSIADVNKDGKINSTDALMILQFTVGILEKI